MTVEALNTFVGHWDLTVDLPGAEDVVGDVEFEFMGGVLIQRTSVPAPEAPDSCCVVVEQGGALVQHYFDSRGVARIYQMTFDGRTWTLERTQEDFTPLDFRQRYIGTFSDDLATITGEWQSGAAGGGDWTRDFGLTYRRRS
jgi:hypothetical protein